MASVAERRVSPRPAPPCCTAHSRCGGRTVTAKRQAVLKVVARNVSDTGKSCALIGWRTPIAPMGPRRLKPGVHEAGITPLANLRSRAQAAQAPHYRCGPGRAWTGRAAPSGAARSHSLAADKIDRLSTIDSSGPRGRRRVGAPAVGAACGGGAGRSQLELDSEHVELPTGRGAVWPVPTARGASSLTRGALYQALPRHSRRRVRAGTFFNEGRRVAAPQVLSGGCWFRTRLRLFFLASLPFRLLQARAG